MEMKESLRVSDDAILEIIDRLRPEWEADRKRGAFRRSGSVSSVYRGFGRMRINTARTCDSLMTNGRMLGDPPHMIRLYVSIPNTTVELILSIPFDLRVGPDPPSKDSFFTKLFSRSQSSIEPVPSLKQTISNVTKIAVSDMRLVFEGCPIVDDESTINLYNICSGCTVYLIPRTRRSSELFLACQKNCVCRSQRLSALNKAVMQTQALQHPSGRNIESS